MAIDFQAFCDKSIHAFAKRGWTRAAQGSSCFYRIEGHEAEPELGCAIGVHIPNEQLDKWQLGGWVRNQSFQALASIGVLVDGPPQQLESELQFLRAFQWAHDESADGNLRNACITFYTHNWLVWPKGL